MFTLQCVLFGLVGFMEDDRSQRERKTEGEACVAPFLSKNDVLVRVLCSGGGFGYTVSVNESCSDFTDTAELIETLTDL